MKHLQSILFSILIASSVYVYVAQQADDQLDEKITLNPCTKKENSQPDNIIFFVTQDDEDNNKPSGQYWPAQDISGPDASLNSKAASAFIADDSYSNVIEEKKIIPEKQSHYLGCFTEPTSQETIYLYGKKDKKDISDDADQADNEDDDDDDNQEENN